MHTQRAAIPLTTTVYTRAHGQSRAVSLHLSSQPMSCNKQFRLSVASQLDSANQKALQVSC